MQSKDKVAAKIFTKGRASSFDAIVMQLIVHKLYSSHFNQLISPFQPFTGASEDKPADSSSTPNESTTGLVGTALYVAPELCGIVGKT